MNECDLYLSYVDSKRLTLITLKIKHQQLNTVINQI